MGDRTIRALRERTKAAFAEASRVGRIPGPMEYSSGHLFMGLNMREAWVKNKKIIGIFLLRDLDAVVEPRLLAFHRAGELYYKAKAEGLEAAMMWKLSQ